MANEITRILRAFSGRCWFIEKGRADEIVSILALRAGGHTQGYQAADERPMVQTEGRIAVLRLHGAIMPRADMLSEMSGAMSLEKFRAAFREAAADEGVRAIILDIDSPGGDVSFVPETVADIRAAQRADRPIIAVANNMAASSAYWIASAADELVVTPSGQVGAIGVYMLHEDLSEALKAEGIAVTFLFEGPRKIEGNPFEPLDDTARAALQKDVAHFYAMFTADVAKFRGVAVAAVRADPEKSDDHFGGGRGVMAKEAVRLGMADRVATFEQTLERVQRKGRGRRRAAIERRRLALI
jgi:signal peptide peptidase SppA